MHTRKLKVLRTVENLPSVFKLHQEPWIDPDGAAGEVIRQQIHQCPSGALNYAGAVQLAARETAITVSKDGPYRVSGAIDLLTEMWGAGASRDHYALCRCGGSKNKPFCDGTHWSNGFKDDRN